MEDARRREVALFRYALIRAAGWCVIWPAVTIPARTAGG